MEALGKRSTQETAKDVPFTSFLFYRMDVNTRAVLRVQIGS
jgi:hypothetical protein